jgi:hypothetical protein
MSGGNFSLTLCALSIAEEFPACLQTYEPEIRALAPGEKALDGFLYAKAWENIRDRPAVFLARLMEGTISSAKALPRMLIGGHEMTAPPVWFPASAFFIVAIVAAAIALARSRADRELAFWALLGGSIAASAGVVYFDDGRRVLVASYPLVAVFLAMGLRDSLPRLPAACANPWLFSRILIATVVLLGACGLAPFLAHALRTTEPLTQIDWQPSANEHVVFGGRRLAGFLVIPDGDPFRDDVPSMHMSDFRRIIASTGYERRQGLVNPDAPQLPFGFVIAARVEKAATSRFIYIAPPDVLTRRDVPAWRLRITDWHRKPSPYWFAPFWYWAVTAEPVFPSDATRR